LSPRGDGTSISSLVGFNPKIMPLRRTI
jgi:hypothetical protein